MNVYRGRFENAEDADAGRGVGLGNFDGIHAGHAALIEKLSGAQGEERSARFVCAIACVMPDGTTLTSRGVMEGRIAHEIKGENGFGYDPIFYLPEYGCTSAEITPEKKNELSHRGKALREMKEKLRNYLDQK